MIATEKTTITVTTTVSAPLQKVWKLFTQPGHIVNWYTASPEWHTPRAENDVTEGGRFNFRMEARDGSFGFDYTGQYTTVHPEQELAYTLDDGRQVRVLFAAEGDATTVTETFEPENTNPEEFQKAGWQAILDSFKNYAETGGKKETLHFQIHIQAPAEKVYSIMLDEKTYREWTAEFSPTSFYRGSWEKGSKIHFIGVNEAGKEEGMVSRIKENIPAQFVSIEHLGMLNGNEEITSGPQVDGWAGALENYRFQPEGTGTLLMIDMDANEQFKSYFEETWPRALTKLKEVCEQ